MTTLDRIFLDTNIYIIGEDDPNTDEGKILQWLGFGNTSPGTIAVIVSEELLEQISRVAKRLRGKDWSGELLGRIWRNPNIRYVFLDLDEFVSLEALDKIPREDIGVYLTAKTGRAECFVSANHRLIRALVAESQEFECLTPAEFVMKYLIQQ